MDWVTLTKREVEDDALPHLCMACGAPSTRRVDESFSHSPEWIGWLYLAGILPGVIAEHFFTRQMRVACPFCDRHRNHWRVVNWVGGLGWLVGGLLGAGLGYLVGALAWPDSSIAGWVGLGVGAGVGIVTWLVVLIYLASTRISATKVTATEITFQGVADAFVKAVKDRQAGPNV